ncbi:MAG: hypothetical protein KAR84_03770 [Elusimicrobiales bacterium]|nr:hypothetical protein [Elusimicrobiales bacterium]
MRFIFITLTCIFVFGLCVHSQGNDPVPTYAGGEIKESGGKLLGVEKLSLDEIKNKILTNLFFRGEVADGFIDAKLYGEVLGDVSGKSYSEVREALIIWIHNNPDKAAEMYFNIYGRKPEGKPKKIKYNSLKGKLNSHFVQLVENLNASAKNFSLDDETLTIAGKRLFEGLLIKPDYANVHLPSFMPAKEEAREEFDFADFKLNHALLEKETKNITLWVSALKNSVEKKIYQEKNSKGYDREKIRAVYINAFRLYKKFIVRASSLKGRKNITAEESLKLEGERLLLRKNLTALQLLMEYGRLNFQTKIFDEKYPDFAFLSSGSEETLKEILKSLNKIEEGELGLKELNLSAAGIYSGVKNSTLKNDFYLWLLAFKKRGDDIRFSCVSDFLIFTYLKTLNPLPRYGALTLRLRKDSSKIEELLLKIKNGGEDEVFSLMIQNSSGGGDIVNTLERMSKSIKNINEYSLANKRVQKLFFDIVFNPFKIYMDSNGKMKIKINYFIGES